MDTRNTTLFSILAGALLVAVLALVGIGGLLIGRTATAQPVAVAGTTPQIIVVGNGEVNVTPDMATVQIGVETSAPTVQEALSQNNTQAQAIIDQIKALGVEDRDIQTSNFSIYPRYDDNGREITGYNVSNMVLVKIRDLQQAGDLLDQVVQAGANRVYGVSFGLADPQAALADAREAAIADARTRAEQMAQAGGANLGSVLLISETIGAQPVPMPMMEREQVLGTGASVPIQSGEQTVSAQVQVTFELR
jgi:uncharacterized protein YggE